MFQNIGPYGYIHYGYVYGGYLPVQRIILKTLYRLGLILLIVWAGRRLPHPALQLCWWAAFFIFQPCTWPLAVPGMPDFVRAQEMDWDQDYGYLTVYLAALYLLQNRKGWPFAMVSGVLLFFLAFAALTKHTTFVLAAGAVGAVVLQKALRRELLAAAWTAVVYVLFLAAHWLMAGQALENFPGFVRGIFAFAAGYNEAHVHSRADPDDADRPFGGSPAVPAKRLQLSGAEARSRRARCWSYASYSSPGSTVLFCAHFSHVMTFFFPVVCLGLLVFHLLLPIERDPPPGTPAYPKLHRFATSPIVLAAGFGLVLLALERSAHFYRTRTRGPVAAIIPAI